MRIDQVKNIPREPHIVQFQPGESRHEKITSPMIIALGEKDFSGSNLAIGFAYITEPDTIIDVAHSHPFDQYLFLIGGDSKNFTDFDADIELTLDGVVNKINYPCYAFVPKGMSHCPLIVTRVGRPLVFIDARLTEEASVRPLKTGK